MSRKRNREVFLSYASQDVDVAARICDALRARKIEVWFDKSALGGGDQWDQQIRHKILNCALFVPIISANSEHRLEGYFRREWKIAADRTRRMADGVPFLVPVVIDATAGATAHVPEIFREVQWIRLPAGQVSAQFVSRVARLLAGETPASETLKPPPLPPSGPPKRLSWRERMAEGLRGALRSKLILLCAIVSLIAVLAYQPLSRYWQPRAPYQPPQPEIIKILSRAQSSMGERSIAVLAFVDMSEKKDQEYFSDGLSEELINQLSRIPDLQVISHTSSFYFKGKNTMIADIAKQLGVSYVLEGSVRKNRGAIRVTAQLIRADNGSDVWSDSYNRDIKDQFEVQGEIAAAVVKALKAKLVPTQPMSTHPTASTEAHNQYLMGLKFSERTDFDDWTRAVEAFRHAIALDPNYASAYAAVAMREGLLADLAGDAAGIRQAEADADKAVELAPEEADSHAARAYVRQTWNWDWAGAQADYTKALTVEPTSASTLAEYGGLLTDLGQFPEALEALRKSVEYDPLRATAWANLGRFLMYQSDFHTAHDAFHRCLELQPDHPYCIFDLGVLQLLEGNAPAALASFKQLTKPEFRLSGIVMAEHSLGHAKASEDALQTMITTLGQENAFQIAETYAWIGNKDKALDWLDRAYGQHDGGLPEIKGDLLLADLRSDPRYKAILRKMHLPP